MAKSDSFFIRAKVTTNGTTFVPTEIDLGSFVNLGVSKSTLLRIHNISVQYADVSAGPAGVIYSLGASGGKIAWQLTTQSQAALVTADDKSLVSAGGLSLFGNSNSTAYAVGQSQNEDINPQMWTQGFLVGVDSLFLGVNTTATITSGEASVSVVLECTLENATQANSVALALSQQ